MSALLPSSIFPQPQSSSVSEQRPKDYQTGVKLFSVITMRSETGAEFFTIEVAQDRSTDERFRKEFGALLAAVLACGLIASAAIAITVTKRGLRPLAEMTRSFERVGPAHLHERVPPAAWPRELRPLAVAFDDMLDRLENSFTRLSQFSADLAHELRTPIANMLGEAQVTLTRTRSPEEYREVIESSVAECERLSGIVDNLLFLARAESADRQIQRTLFDGRAAIEKIAAYYQTIAEDRHVTIRCTGEGEIYADAVLFARAVSNLVDNALRFTPNSGSISISIAVRGAQSEISVSDNGCGIPAEHLPRVFDRFYRADSSRSSDGVGLGLALVKSITDLHGGSARAESEVNRGTIVVLTFPNKNAAESHP
jgi:two-component system heavy metal sensor histidine kinase CusS